MFGKALRDSDGGWKSRKLWFAVWISVLILVGGYFLTPAVLPEIVAGLVSVAAIYLGGNAASKWVTLRNGGTVTPKPKLAPKTTSPDPEGEAEARQ